VVKEKYLLGMDALSFLASCAEASFAEDAQWLRAS
jgi:hypothetical protein